MKNAWRNGKKIYITPICSARSACRPNPSSVRHQLAQGKQPNSKGHQATESVQSGTLFLAKRCHRGGVNAVFEPLVQEFLKDDQLVFPTKKKKKMVVEEQLLAEVKVSCGTER